MNNTILVVDDSLINIDVLTGILSPYYTIMAAISGESAIKVLGRKKPDLVLLDLSMPGIDGFGVLSYMKEQKDLANIPVIFVTGEHDADCEEKGLALGAVDYIKKPYNVSVVKNKVKNHLELKTYRDNLEQLVTERTQQLYAHAKELQQRTKQLAASHEAIIMGMSYMAESRDSVTGQHIDRIKNLSRILTVKMLELYPDIITDDVADKIVMFSPLHDVGKISISDAILKKQGTLTAEEFEIIKNHTQNAAELLRKIELFYSADDADYLDIAIEIAESHHEKYDGTGYPYGLNGEEIPLSARIISVADVYDALRSERPYKKAFSHEQAVDIILSGDGRTMPEHFDPKVLNAFRVENKQFEKFYVKTGDTTN